jgi:monoamine oxidase
MTLSRRALIHHVGRAGGFAAAYRTMAAMGLLPVPAAYAGPPTLPPGENRRILVLGAGIAGMVLAWELRKAGYDVTVLEARPRTGGRNWSLRAGDEILETDSAQRVRWASGDHLYFNPGPARIPWHHEGILAYCRELGVRLEVISNDNRGALMHDAAAFGGVPQRNGAVVGAGRGAVAELAAKATDKMSLAEPVTPEDQERLRAFLRAFGALDKDLVYRGGPRAGYAAPPGIDEGRTAPPLDLRELLRSAFWQGPMQWGEVANQAATMMQPVNGMGMIGATFGRELGAEIITTGAIVTGLRRTGAGAAVDWRDSRTGDRRTTEAPLVVCTLPFSVLRTLPAEFAPATKSAIAGLDYVPAGKVAFEADSRFWETDQQIYGGISWTSGDATQIWYPSAGIGQRKGILVGAYIWSEEAGNAFAAKPPEQRLADTLTDDEVLHPGCRAHLLNGVSVAWKKVPCSLGAWAEWTREGRAQSYRALLEGDGAFLFAGEHLSYINGWQEGAVRSAHAALERIAERMAAR